MRTRANAVSYGMRRLAWVSGFVNARANSAIDFGEWRAIADDHYCLIEYLQQQIEQTICIRESALPGQIFFVRSVQ